jgi:hypothetical protein
MSGWNLKKVENFRFQKELSPSFHILSSQQSRTIWGQHVFLAPSLLMEEWIMLVCKEFFLIMDANKFSRAECGFWKGIVYVQGIFYYANKNNVRQELFNLYNVLTTFFVSHPLNVLFILARCCKENLCLYNV